MFKRMLAYPVRLFSGLVLVAAVGGCGGGGSGGSTDVTVPNSAEELIQDGGGGQAGTELHSVGGIVIGLESGSDLELQNNGKDTLAINKSGQFLFPTKLGYGSEFDVSIARQPSNGQRCLVVEYPEITGSGKVYSKDIETVRINCAAVKTLAGTNVRGLGDTRQEEAVFYDVSGIAVDQDDNIYVADTQNNVIRKIDVNGTVSTIAGSSERGYVDGVAVDAEFSFSSDWSSVIGMAVDTAGNVFVSDPGNHVIRKITPAGVVSTFSGTGDQGYVDGAATAARYSTPEGLALAPDGSLYVADSGNNVIRKVLPDGSVETFAGTSSYGYLDGTGSEAEFRGPADVAIGASGVVYVSDAGNSRIRKITASAEVSTVAGSGEFYSHVDGFGTEADFGSLMGITVDPAGNIYIADYLNSSIRMLSPNGLVSTLAGVGDGIVDGVRDGHAMEARFYSPFDVAVTSDGKVVVVGGDKVRVVDSVPYSYEVGGHVVGLSPGESLVLQNNGKDDLPIQDSGFFKFQQSLTEQETYSVSILSQSDSNPCRLVGESGGFVSGDVFSVKINCATVETLAGSGTPGYVDGIGIAAEFDLEEVSRYSPGSVGLDMDGAGNLYMTDVRNHVIRKITPDGVVSTFAGSGVQGYSDGVASEAQFNRPSGLAVDDLGNVFVADTFNDVIRKITPSGTVSTFAGDGWSGYTDGDGSSARFYEPRGLAIDSEGNIYVADTGNHIIRMVAKTGLVSTYAGFYPGGGYVNGTIGEAEFREPADVEVDTSGNVYVIDSGANAVRKITPEGRVMTFAGVQAPYSSPDTQDSTGTGARFRMPVSIAVGADGVLYVADANNNRIRRINGDGTVTTVAGSLGGFLDGNGEDAQFDWPTGIVVGPSNELYVSDGLNNVIRKIVQ